MRNKFYYIILSLIVTLTSCDYLNVPFDNRTRIDSEEKVGMLLVSAYSRASDWTIMELSSDNVDHNVGANLSIWTLIEEEAYHWEPITGIRQDTPHYFWNETYKAIAAANLALESIEVLEKELGLTPRLRAFRAEALMTRAYHHFLLANLFCMPYGSNSANDLGLPYMDHVENEVAPKYERGNLADFYEKIHQDIQAALPYVVDDFLTVRRYRFNRQAAYAFAARFYLYRQDYNRAIEYASVVLGSNPVAVLRNWREGGDLAIDIEFRSNWYVHADNRANLLNRVTGSLHQRVVGPFGGGARYSLNERNANSEGIRANTPWTTSHTMQYFRTFGLSGDNPKILVPRFYEYFEYSDRLAGIGFPHMIQVDLTTDDVLLNRAEAHIMLGNYDAAVADMNVFMTNFTTGTARTKDQIVNFYRNMAYYTPFEPTSKKHLRNPDLAIVEGSEKENLLHAVLHLRRIISTHEGLRWLDIRRFGIEIYRREVRGGRDIMATTDFLAVDDLRRAIQLPESVIAAGMERNPR